MSDDFIRVSDMSILQLFRELAYYGRRCRDLEREVTGSVPFKGKDHIWVEEVVEKKFDDPTFIIYWCDSSGKKERWIAQLVSLMEREDHATEIPRVEKEIVDAQPFDYRKVLK